MKDIDDSINSDGNIISLDLDVHKNLKKYKNRIKIKKNNKTCKKLSSKKKVLIKSIIIFFS